MSHTYALRKLRACHPVITSSTFLKETLSSDRIINSHGTLIDQRRTSNQARSTTSCHTSVARPKHSDGRGRRGNELAERFSTPFAVSGRGTRPLPPSTGTAHAVSDFCTACEQAVARPSEWGAAEPGGKQKSRIAKLSQIERVVDVVQTPLRADGAQSLAARGETTSQQSRLGK